MSLFRHFGFFPVHFLFPPSRLSCLLDSEGDPWKSILFLFLGAEFQSVPPALIKSRSHTPSGKGLGVPLKSRLWPFSVIPVLPVAHPAPECPEKLPTAHPLDLGSVIVPVTTWLWWHQSRCQSLLPMAETITPLLTQAGDGSISDENDPVTCPPVHLIFSLSHKKPSFSQKDCQPLHLLL